MGHRWRKLFRLFAHGIRSGGSFLSCLLVLRPLTLLHVARLALPGFKYLLCLVILTTVFPSCNEGLEIPEPENRQTVYQITPAGQTIEHPGIRLEVPGLQA